MYVVSGFSRTLYAASGLSRTRAANQPDYFVFSDDGGTMFFSRM
jgi:hypothetical protein